MQRKNPCASALYCLESFEERIFLSASVAGSTLKPGVPKPTAAQISAMLKQTAVAMVARPTNAILADQADVSTPSATGTYSAAQFDTSYGIDQLQDNGGTGAGQTIAIIDAYDDTTITSDLATFDSQMNLPAPPNFWIVGETGGAPTTNAPPSGQNLFETALDVEWAHAVAPQANILLVEADSLSNYDLVAQGVAWVDTQTTYPNVCAVSMSFYEPDNSSAETLDNYFTTPAGHTGITFLACSGDNGGYAAATSTISANWPAAAPNVVGVGGTTLVSDAASNVASEIGWGYGTAPSFEGSGGGISTIETVPSYQVGVIPPSATGRSVPDVSLDGDPYTGVAVCDAQDEGAGTPWLDVAGTSLATPCWAGLIAIADQQRASNGLGALDGATQTLPMLYALPASDFNDITVGDNGVYDATAGYDFVTGRGTPVAFKLVNDLSGQTAVPDLTFSTPSGWQSPLVVTDTSGSRSDGGLIEGAPLYVDWNGINAGASATSTTFDSEVLVDGLVVQTLTTSAPLAAGATFGATDLSIGTLTAGTHTISVQVNYLNEQGETNTIDNTYSRTITIAAATDPDIVPYTPDGWSNPIVATNVNGGTTDTTLHDTDTIYLDFALANLGLSDSNQLFFKMVRDGQFVTWYTTTLQSYTYTEVTAYKLGSLPAGTYTLTLLNNYNQATAESDYSNNDFTKVITVLGNTGTISGTVFQDHNADGISNGSDAGLAGQTVYLDVNSDSKLDVGDIYTTTTAAGAFTLSSVPAGSYTLREASSNDVVTSPSAHSYSISLSTGQNLSGYTFGDFPIAFTGGSASDNYAVQLDATGTTLQILVGGVLTYSAPKSSVPFLSFSPGLGSDSLAVNTGSGNPIPPGGIFYNSAAAYVDTLQLNGTSGADSITANAGQLLFGSSPITFLSTQNVVVDPKSGSDTLAVNAGTVSVPPQTPGGGILTRTFANLSVAANAKLIFTSPASHSDRAVVVVTTLSVNASAKLDLGNNDMIIHGAAPSLVTGYNAGLWNGNGIDSSAAAGDATKRTALGELINNASGSPIVAMFDGQPVVLNDTLIKYTYYGDANLDGTVNALDFNALATNYAHTGNWQQGDFNYSGSVNSTDFDSLASNFGASFA